MTGPRMYTPRDGFSYFCLRVCENYLWSASATVYFGTWHDLARGGGHQQDQEKFYKINKAFSNVAQTFYVLLYKVCLTASI